MQSCMRRRWTRAGGSDTLGDGAVANAAVELACDHVSPVGVEDVRWLPEERYPVERRTRLKQPDELELLRALSLRLEVADGTVLGGRETRKSFLLIKLMAGRTGQRVVLDMFPVVE